MELIELKGQIEAGIKSVSDEVKAIEKRLAEQVKDQGAGFEESKGKLADLAVKSAELMDRLALVEQKATAAAEQSDRMESIGQQFVKGVDLRAMSKLQTKSAALEVKTAIVNATGQNQPLVPAQRLPGIAEPARRQPRVRDLFPRGVTTSNLIEFAKQNVFTNNAGPQYQASPVAYENVTKPESAVTFTLATSAVVTLAHFIPASRQVLDDSPMLASYIDGLLMYGLMLEEEDQLLNGAGTSGNLSGVLASGNYTAYSGAVSGDTRIDTVRRAIGQLQVANNMPNAIVINPADWTNIELTKTSDNAYVFSNPQAQASATLWGVPVVATNAIASGTFLVGDFAIGAQIFDREGVNVAIAYEDSTNFQKNMVTIRAEQRLALAVYRPTSFVSGSF